MLTAPIAVLPASSVALKVYMPKLAIGIAGTVMFPENEPVLFVWKIGVVIR
jgi:hypothetical protein